MSKGNSAASRPGKEGIDHLARLHASLEVCEVLVQSTDRSGDNGNGESHPMAYEIDMRAFDMAVEGALFFETAHDRAPDWDDDVRRKVGSTLAATANLKRSVGEKLSLLSVSPKAPDDLREAMHGLSKIVCATGARLESLCRSLIVMELCSLALIPGVRIERHGAGSGRTRLLEPTHVVRGRHQS